MRRETRRSTGLAHCSGIGRDSLLNPEMTIADEKTEPSSAAELEPSAVRREGRCGHEVTPSTASYLPDPEAAGRCAVRSLLVAIATPARR